MDSNVRLAIKIGTQNRDHTDELADTKAGILTFLQRSQSPKFRLHGTNKEVYDKGPSHYFSIHILFNRLDGTVICVAKCFVAR